MKIGEQFRGIVAQLVEQGTLVWRNNSEVATNFVSEVLQLITHGPQRKDDSSMAGTTFSSDGVIGHDYYVRALVNSFLIEIDSSVASPMRTFVDTLITALLDLHFEPNYARTYTLHTLTHKRRVSIILPKLYDINL